MFIKNTTEILKKSLPKIQMNFRKIGLQAISRAISAVKPKNLMEKSIRVVEDNLLIGNEKYDLREYQKIYIIGGGKATREMAFTLERILSKAKFFNYNGIINVPSDIENQESLKESKIDLNFSSHPIPNENGIKGTSTMMKIIEDSTAHDLIICLISGGGSALLPLPKNGITLKDLQETNSLLLSSGTSIHEINTIRKHISDFKGGNLAKKIYDSSGATLISLIISDVVGDNLDSIASGPTVPDETTFRDAFEIIENYNLLDKIPVSVKEHLTRGFSDSSLENPKSKDPCFKNVHNYLIGSVRFAAEKVSSFLTNEGFEVDYFSNTIIGEAREFGESLYKIISNKIQKKINSGIYERIALIGTGELTVTIRGKGTGGRNQEMLLSFLNHVKREKFDYNFIIIGVNLDGIEGNSKAMGALIDNYLLDQMILMNINPEKYLQHNDSNTFFKKMKSELISGPTGSNVNDLILILISR
ncbi:MAG: glycerate kinase [Candidatus Hermodarchaeota archaeon]